MVIAGNSANSVPYTLRVTITGIDDAPELISSFGTQMAAVGEAVSINLNDFIKDPDVGDRLNLMVRFLDDQGNPLPSNHGLSYNSSNQTIEGVPTIAGTYLVDITAVTPTEQVPFALVLRLKHSQSEVITRVRLLKITPPTPPREVLHPLV